MNLMKLKEGEFSLKKLHIVGYNLAAVGDIFIKLVSKVENLLSFQLIYI